MPRGLSSTDEALGARHKLRRVVYSARLAGVLRDALGGSGGRVVLHFHNQYNAFFFLRSVPRRLRGRALVCYTNHSGAWNGEWAEVSGTIRRRYFQEAYALRRADAALVLNEATRRNLVEHAGVPAGRVHLVTNGVDTAVYRPMPEGEREALRSGLLGPSARYVFQCGSVCENKGQLVTVRCLARLLAADPGLFLVFAGGVVDAGYLGEVMALAGSLGVGDRVVYLGERRPGRELAGLYAAAEACVLPSTYESFGLAALEALSCGTPVVQRSGDRVVGLATEGEGMFRFGDEAGYAGLVEGLLRMSRDERARLSASARRNVEERYSWGRVADELARLLEEVDREA
jgi:D-inositol-3-phosphate glycosyltransferase